MSLEGSSNTINVDNISLDSMIEDNNSFVEQCVNILIDDESFINECKNDIGNILKDNKITSNDIPYIIKIIVLAFKKSKTIDINDNDLNLFIKILLVELLKKLNVHDDLEKILTPEINDMIDTCVDLLRVQLITTSYSIFKSLKKCFSNCTKSDCCKSKCCK